MDIFIVLNEYDQICGVYDDLEDAYDTWKIIIKNMNENPEYEYLRSDFGDEWEDELETTPAIEEWKINEGFIDSYYTEREIQDRLNDIDKGSKTE